MLVLGAMYVAELETEIGFEMELGVTVGRVWVSRSQCPIRGPDRGKQALTIPTISSYRAFRSGRG